MSVSDSPNLELVRAAYDAFHRRNVQRQYLAAELRWLAAPPSPAPR